MALWIITGGTESGDEFAYLIEHDGMPSCEQIDAFLYYNGWDEEYREIGWTNWDMQETSPQTVPTPTEIDEYLEDKADEF